MFLILYCSIFKELCAALATAYLLYHIHSSLSSTFWNFFRFFFQISELLSDIAPCFRRMLISSVRSNPYLRSPSFSLFKRFQTTFGTLCFRALSFECLSIISRFYGFVKHFFVFLPSFLRIILFWFLFLPTFMYVVLLSVFLSICRLILYN